MYSSAAQLVWFNNGRVVYMIVYGCMQLKELVALFRKISEISGAMIALSLVTSNMYMMYIHTYTHIYTCTLVCR